MMHLLLATTPDQQSYLPRFSRLTALVGHKVSVMMSTPTTLSEVETMCLSKGIDAIICTNAKFMEKILYSLPDFRDPIDNKALTLDDYQGSLMVCKGPASKGPGIPVLVLNPPEHLQTVSYAPFTFSHFITKITKPETWYKATKFNWKLFDPKDHAYWLKFLTASRIIGIDIETPRNNPDRVISCISFTGWHPETHITETVVIPFDSIFNLSVIRTFCALPVAKVLQGGQYDALYLLRFNCPILYWYYDTLNLFHAYYSELPKVLEFVAAWSIREIRFWKDDGKTGNLEDYYRYNALDSWATVNAIVSLISAVPDWALVNYQQEFPLNFPCLHCEVEGWKVDKERFFEVEKEKTVAAETQLAGIRKMVSAPNFNPNSHVQVKKLFNVLGCGDLPSTNKANMLKARYRSPLNDRVLGEIVEYKANAKLLSTYIKEVKFWEWRLYYRIDPAKTDTGRLASTQSSYWCGFQIQNIPRGDSIKQFLVADAGWLLKEPDASQSEARCVFYLAGEEKGIELVESGKDYHSWNVQAFFGIPYTEVWDETKKKCKSPVMKSIRDDVSKRTNHGANYNMTEGVMLDTMGPKNVAKAKLLLKLDPFWSFKKVCRYLLDQYAKTYPKVKGLWYEEIIKQIELAKKLVSPFSWTRHFFGNVRANKHYLNAAVAHGPQNLSVGIINRGFYKIWWESIYGCLRDVVRIKAQIHDSIPYQFREVGERNEEWITSRVKEFMTIPVQVKGADKVTRTLVIPISMSESAVRWSETK